MRGDPTLERMVQGNGLALCAAGPWTARFAPLLEQIVADAEKLTGSRPNIFIDVSQVSKLDTFGAWLIERLRRSLTQGGIEAKIAGLSANYSSLVDEVRRVKAAPAFDTTSVTVTGMLDQIGRSMVGIGATIVGLIDMLGAVLAASGRVMIHPRSFRLTSSCESVFPSRTSLRARSVASRSASVSASSSTGALRRAVSRRSLLTFSACRTLSAVRTSSGRSSLTSR